MYVLLLLLLLALTVAVCAQETALVCHLPNGGDRRSNKNRLKIVAWNVYWLFLVDWETGVAPNGPWKTKADAEKHADEIAAQLDEMDADIYMLTEVEDCETLGLVRSKMEKGEQYRVFFVQGGDSATGQDVILLSRVDPVHNPKRSSARFEYPIGGSECGYDGAAKQTTASKHLYTTFVVDNFPPIFLVGAHLTARPTEAARCAQREAQASILSDIIEQAVADDPELQVVVLGDLNDFDDENADASNSKPTSKTLQILKSSAKQSLKADLISTSEYVDQENRWTYCNGCSRPKCTQLDHLLASPRLIAMARDVGAEMSQRNKACRAAHGTDHFPVMLDLFACEKGAAGCACTDAGECSADLQCSAEIKRCVYAAQCNEDEPGSHACTCNQKERKRATQAELENDPERAMILTGMFDGPLEGGTPKGIEILILQDVPDMSKYSLAVSNNGGGLDGPEWTFPVDQRRAGEFIYAVDNTTSGRSKAGVFFFEDFFGFNATYAMKSQAQSSGIVLNGDDSIELYYDKKKIIDRYGKPVYEKEETFFFQDGWVKRKNCTTHDTDYYVKSHWTIEPAAWTRSITVNAEASKPFPVGSVRFGCDSNNGNATTAASTTTAAEYTASAIAGSDATTTARAADSSTTAGKPVTPAAACLEVFECIDGLCQCEIGQRGCDCDQNAQCDTGLICVSETDVRSVCLLGSADEFATANVISASSQLLPASVVALSTVALIGVAQCMLQ